MVIFFLLITSQNEIIKLIYWVGIADIIFYIGNYIFRSRIVVIQVMFFLGKKSGESQTKLVKYILIDNTSYLLYHQGLTTL